VEVFANSALLSVLAGLGKLTFFPGPSTGAVPLLAAWACGVCYGG
jgi:hypothetical protein